MNEREEAPVVALSRRAYLAGRLSAATSAALDLTMRSGLFSAVLVGVGAVSLAAMLWDLLGASDANDPIVAGARFVLATSIAVPVCFFFWVGSCRVVAARFGAEALVLMRWDAPTYLAFLAYPCARVAFDGAPAASAWVTFVAVVVAKLLPLARILPAVRDVVITGFCTRSIVFVVGWIAASELPTVPGHGTLFLSPLRPWAQWDGVHYLQIAARGYIGTDIAFFPFYPTLLRIGGSLVSSDIVAGFLISNTAFLIGLWFLRDIALRMTGDDATAGRALWYLSIFPASLFFSAVYSESVFFALTVATFAQLDRRRWLLAGLLGGLAAITRLAGVFLIVPFLIEAFGAMQLDAHLGLGERRRRLLDALGCAACIPLALFAFMILEAVLTGDLLAFEHVQSHWQRAIAPPWESVWRSLTLVATSRDPSTIAVQSIELAFTLLAVVLLIDGARSLRPSYWWYALLSFLVPLSTSSLMSVPRFTAVIFPLFIVLAERGEKPLVDRLVVAISLPLLGLFTAFFVTGRWVA